MNVYVHACQFGYTEQTVDTRATKSGIGIHLMQAMWISEAYFLQNFNTNFNYLII